MASASMASWCFCACSASRSGEQAGVSADAAASGQVALLIDFENLVRAVDEEDIDCEAVFRLADEYSSPTHTPTGA